MASEAELKWWNRFSDIMGKHWRLTPYLNSAIRSEYIDDYRNFLFKDGGRFLDVGCGTGWIGHYFAKRGMCVDGIDFSEEQLINSRRLAGEAGIKSIEFFSRDIVKDPLNGRFNEYDSIMVNAVLHHLSLDEITGLITNLSLLLKENGRLYVYEPLVKEMDNRVKYTASYSIGFFVRLFIYSINKTISMFGFLDEEFKIAIQQCYTGSSPDEKAIEYNFLRKVCENSGLMLTALVPYHHFSLAYAMTVMKAIPPVRDYLAKFAKLFYALDKFLVKIFGWNNICVSENDSFLCSLLLFKDARLNKE